MLFYKLLPPFCRLDVPWDHNVEVPGPSLLVEKRGQHCNNLTAGLSCQSWQLCIRQSVCELMEDKLRVACFLGLSHGRPSHVHFMTGYQRFTNSVRTCSESFTYQFNVLKFLLHMMQSSS